MVRYPVRIVGGPHGSWASCSIIDKEGLPLDMLGTHPDRQAQAIADAINAAHRAGADTQRIA